MPPRQYIANGRQGMTAVFRYFDVKGVHAAAVTVRGTARGRVLIKCGENGDVIGEIAVEPVRQWKKFTAPIKFPLGKQSVAFVFEGRGKLNFLEFALE